MKRSNDFVSDEEQEGPGGSSDGVTMDNVSLGSKTPEMTKAERNTIK